MAPPVDIQRSELNSALRTLDIIINGIPDAFPDGSIDGPLAQYFTGIDFDNEFPYETVDTQWMRVFRREWTQEQLQQLVVRGPLGLRCAHAFITNAIAVPGIEKRDGLFLICEKVKELIQLIART
jgi:hypothetical protein